jgi:peptidoglycan/xylan/chitin deacetylase (PgdA/CDA1 family)
VEPADRSAAFLLASQRCAKTADVAQTIVISTIEDELDVEPLATKDCPMMTWDQVHSLRKAGHIIGSHSLTHPNLAYVDEQTQWKEILESKVQLETRLQAPVTHFSYPNPIMNPNFNSRTVQSTRRAGYTSAATMMTGPVRTGHDPHLIPRVSAPSNIDEFIWRAENALLGRRL